MFKELSLHVTKQHCGIQQTRAIHIIQRFMIKNQKFSYKCGSHSKSISDYVDSYCNRIMETTTLKPDSSQFVKAISNYQTLIHIDDDYQQHIYRHVENLVADINLLHAVVNALSGIKLQCVYFPALRNKNNHLFL